MSIHGFLGKVSQTYFHYNKDWDSGNADVRRYRIGCHRPISTTTRIETIVINVLGVNDLRSQTYFHYNKDWDCLGTM